MDFFHLPTHQVTIWKCTLYTSWEQAVARSETHPPIGSAFWETQAETAGTRSNFTEHAIKV